MAQVNNESVREFLIKKFREFLMEKRERRLKIAHEIDAFATNLARSGEIDRLQPELREILHGCLDLHHWGDKELPPIDYRRVKDIKEALKRLKRVCRD